MTRKISMCRAVVVYQGGMSKIGSSSGSDIVRSNKWVMVVGRDVCSTQHEMFLSGGRANMF